MKHVAITRVERVPTAAEIEAIPLALAGVYYLTDKETRTARSRCYAMNRNNAAGIIIRALRHVKGKSRRNPLLIWRIRPEDM